LVLEYGARYFRGLHNLEKDFIITFRWDKSIQGTVAGKYFTDKKK